MTRRTQPTSKTPTAYSYVRFSSPTQAEGDSVRRQTELRDAWIRKSNAVLDTSLTLRDEGVSAFRGSHRDNSDRTALAAFLELVRRGRIPRGSYLIVESLDRLTREHIRPALTLLLNLIESGIRIVQLLPVEAVYDDKVEPMSLMMAIMELSRGHFESQMKSERLGRVWAEKKANAATGKPITRAVPSWVRVHKGSFVLIPDKAKTIRRIFELAVAGYGLGAITKKFNGEQVPAIARGKNWARSYVAKILDNRATFGEYQPHKGRAGKDRKPDGSPVANYFPAVITENTFHAAQAALASRKNKGGRPLHRVGIFTGLLHEARDGGTLQVVNKGERSSGPALTSYKAAQGVKGAKAVGFPLDTFEKAILSRLREIDPKELLPEHDATDDRVSILEGRQEELTNRAAALQAELLTGDVPSIAAVLRMVDAELVKVNEELLIANREASSPVAVAWDEARGLLATLDKAADQTDARTRLRAALRRITQSVWCLFVDVGSAKLAVVQMWFTGGAQRSYLIQHTHGHGNAAAKRKATFDVKAFKWGGGALDLRKTEIAALVERELVKAATATNVKPKK